MPESKIITTQTTLTVIGTAISLKTLYLDESITGVISAFLSETVGGETLDGTPFIEGEGGVTIGLGYYPAELDFQVNGNGELIVIAPDSANFSVDTDTGQLVYTY